jgi:hypothetical protein
MIRSKRNRHIRIPGNTNALGTTSQSDNCACLLVLTVLIVTHVASYNFDFLKRITRVWATG